MRGSRRRRHPAVQYSKESTEAEAPQARTGITHTARDNTCRMHRADQ
jgi:hypothetical protein